MSTKVIYHRADFDGIFCREIARKFLPEAELIGWDFTDPEPYLSKDDDLYILDLSVPSLMEHPKLIWIDHHKSAIDKYSNSIRGYRIDGVAACRLAWQFFQIYTPGQDPLPGAEFPVKDQYIQRTIEEPLAVRLAGEYDIWDRRDPNAELFQHGLRSRELTAYDWCSMLQLDKKLSIPEIEALIDVGHTKGLLNPDGTTPNPTVLGLLDAARVVQFVQRQSDKAAIEACGYDLHWQGLTFLAVNAGARGFNSFLFTAGLKPKHDACLGWRMIRPGKYSVSLYHAPGKEQHDLSVIASACGGGGHRGACGFTCETLPF